MELNIIWCIFLSIQKIWSTCTGTCVRICFKQFVVSFQKFHNYVLFYQEPEPPQNRPAPKPCFRQLFASWIRIRIATNVWIHFTDWRTSNQMKTTANTKVHWQLLRYGSLCRSFSMSGVRSLRSLEVTGWGWPRKDCYHQSMGRFFSFSNRLAP